MSGTFNDRGELEPSTHAIIAAFGKKESGKSIIVHTFASTWPYDMVVLDVAGDDGPMPRKPGTGTHDVHLLSGTVDTLPRTWPEGLRREQRPMILRYVPDPGSPTELEDMDALTGLAFDHSSKERPAMLVVHEIGRVAPAGRTPANMRRVVNHNRHRGLTMAVAGPRPITVEPLVIAQADVVYVFELNNSDDRERVAKNIGWGEDRREFDAAVAALGPHEYLRYDAREPKPAHPDDTDWRLVHFAALPEAHVAAVTRWRDGDQRSAGEDGHRPQPGRPAAG